MGPPQDVPSKPQNEPDSIDTASPPQPWPAHCPPRNVLFFGETGVGKSSVINMLVGQNTEAACVSGGAKGCTFASTGYKATIDGEEFVLWDTVGLNEGEHGSTPSPLAECNLEELMRNMKGGLSLLVYVIRGTRFRQVVQINYELFYRAICGKQVPIVAVVTGLENEEPMESWWSKNVADLQKFGLVFEASACITAFRGKVLKTRRHAFEDEYEESKLKLQRLVPRNCSPEPIFISAQGVGEIVHSEPRPVHHSSPGGLRANIGHDNPGNTDMLDDFGSWLIHWALRVIRGYRARIAPSTEARTYTTTEVVTQPRRQGNVGCQSHGSSIGHHSYNAAPSNSSKSHQLQGET
ncbi:hypothetical protein BS17DRAFT_818399 [Gyrodon lividus]|nr:hypothetical protein BS17DRAFT_818399 [Gyrodon lividus]